MLRPRIGRERLRALLRQFPAVTVLGARQIGKSTLARWALPDFAYFDLEATEDFRRLADDPEFVFSEHPRLILDEVQRLPALFPALRSYIDRHPRNKVVLLGSASPGLLGRVSESLAGCVGIFELGGISVFEHDATRLWLTGAFPGCTGAGRRPKRPTGIRPTFEPASSRTSLSSAFVCRARGCATS
jgi:uncharacterized protein